MNNQKIFFLASIIFMNLHGAEIDPVDRFKKFGAAVVDEMTRQPKTFFLVLVLGLLLMRRHFLLQIVKLLPRLLARKKLQICN